jgi:23S rRNA (adenine2503-C2)-methyltransferase
MGCAFCETGRMGLLRNLTTPEIINQLFVARFILGFQVRNLVFMGMGEPKDLYQAMQAYNSKKGKSILIAYVMMKGQNDKLEHADQLAHYLQGLQVKINLIPYNPQSHDRYQPPEQHVLEAFTARLQEKGYYTLLRQTKGQKIMAACGQLGNLKLRRQGSKKPHFL